MTGPRANDFDAHALMVAGLANSFQMLRVGASIWDGKRWYVIHTVTTLLDFELEHGVETERYKYNSRSMTLARRTRKPFLGSHAGFSDWFVPIISGGKVRAVLVSGPFATSHATSADVVDRWRTLSGRQGHPADPEFAQYVSVTLSTLVLEGPRVALFGRLLSRLARLIANDGRAPALLDEAESVRDELEKARMVDRTWDAARAMVDERTSQAWASPHQAEERSWIGLSRVADQVLVGLFVGNPSDVDPVDDLLRRKAFQRTCVDLARARHDVISGPIGDHGVTFLASSSVSLQRKESRLLDLSDKAAALARHFGLRIHFGIGTLPADRPLHEHYRAALAAAESALSEGRRIVRGSRRTTRTSFELGRLRQELRALMEERPANVPARFDHYLEVVALRYGYRLDQSIAHLETTFETIVTPLRTSGAIDEKSFSETWETLERSAAQATTMADLFAAYRRAIGDVTEAIRRPAAGGQDRSVRRAVEYIHQHLSESLSLRVVARVAGFAPNYFSSLFKRHQKMTFEHYIRQVRVERAKQLLSTTELRMNRVAQLAGLGSRIYLARVFKEDVGTTPIAYRAHPSRRRLKSFI